MLTGCYSLREEGEHLLARANDEELKRRVKGSIKGSKALGE